MQVAGEAELAAVGGEAVEGDVRRCVVSELSVSEQRVRRRRGRSARAAELGSEAIVWRWRAP